MTPLTVGRIPLCLTNPAFFIDFSLCETLETNPKVPKQRLESEICQPEDNFNTDFSVDFTIILAEVPAALTKRAPDWGNISKEEILSNKLILEKYCVDPLFSTFFS